MGNPVQMIGGIDGDAARRLAQRFGVSLGRSDQVNAIGQIKGGRREVVIVVRHANGAVSVSTVKE